MPPRFDFAKYAELLREARKAFLADSAYAIAVAKTGGTFAARKREKEESEETPLSAV